MTRGSGSYQPWPVAHLSELEERTASGGLEEKGVAVRSDGAIVDAQEIAGRITAYFETSRNPSRAADSSWFVEGASGRVLLLHPGQCCPASEMEDFIRDGCA